MAALLRGTKRIAVVGLSNKPNRASYDVGRYLVAHGYQIVPVHPNIPLWEGIPVRKELGEIEGAVDIVDLFLNADRVPDVVPAIVALKPKAAWLQLGVVNNEAAKTIRAAGIMVIQDRCIKIEDHRLLRG
ncbi:MAG: CoA-binding protein [Nitrospinae bacterium]|nr:CoA-binding protein [Nitrospinota bacterium]